jgi:dipeptidyl aminopeptidase/acylaminoacyl peptidase
MLRWPSITVSILLLGCTKTVAPEPAAAPPPPKPDYSALYEWERPDQDILDVLHAPQLPWVWTAPGGNHLLLADPVLYPSLADLSAPMHKLAGLRVNPKRNAPHGEKGAVAPRVMAVETGATADLDLPEGSEVLEVDWTVDGERFALQVAHEDHIGLWVGDVSGTVQKMDGALNPLLGSAVTWMPDGETLRVLRVPAGRGPVPPPPDKPFGPTIAESSGAGARSTYEARNLLETGYDDLLFAYYTTSEVVLLDAATGEARVLGEPRPYATAAPSPDGAHLLVEYVVPPWSHEVGWSRFAHEIEVWSVETGDKAATVASMPLADSVPTHGVPEGPRGVDWSSTDPATLYWLEALDGGDWTNEVEHRDRIVRLAAPFTADPAEVFLVEHRAYPQGWTEDGEMLLVQYERDRRWIYTSLLDVDAGEATPWYDRNIADRYGDPGSPVMKRLDNGHAVMRQHGDRFVFRGSGATPDGDRPFVDLYDPATGETERLFRSPADRYERVVAFMDDEDRFLFRSESPTDVPNYYVGTLGDAVEAADGEATRALERRAITTFTDPTPQLRAIDKQLVTYERADGVPLSFELKLPPGHEPGTPLPTVVYAYPREYSGGEVAGQVSGSTQRFLRFWGPTHQYFLLRGYAVLDRTAMPMIGDPETVYDTFVPQLVADAEAAVAKAVEMGVADPDRIGVIGHSHGGLMVANLLAHTDLFAAGIARSGSYNKTMQPFGYQSERRSLFEAREAYINASPTFFADQVNEPVLVIHGDDDANPGTLTIQSEVFFEAVRGAGGTARMVLLPNEDHGYRAVESIEHTLWEQLRWFDAHVKNARSDD